MLGAGYNKMFLPLLKFNCPVLLKYDFKSPFTYNRKKLVAVCDEESLYW